jgi:hypothetical protein
MSRESQINWVMRIQNRENYGTHLKRNLFSDSCQNTKSLHLKNIPHCRQKFAFSDDGLFYVSSGPQQNDVVVWPFDEVLHTWTKPKPILLETKHNKIPQGFAISSDNSRIYNSSWGSQFFINDAHTCVLFLTPLLYTHFRFFVKYNIHFNNKFFFLIYTEASCCTTSLLKMNVCLRFHFNPTVMGMYLRLLALVVSWKSLTYVTVQPVSIELQLTVSVSLVSRKKIINL